VERGFGQNQREASMAALPRARASTAGESALAAAAELCREEEVRFSTVRSLQEIAAALEPVCL